MLFSADVDMCELAGKVLLDSMRSYVANHIAVSLLTVDRCPIYVVLVSFLGWELQRGWSTLERCCKGLSVVMRQTLENVQERCL